MSDLSEDKFLAVQREMAFQRACGELRSMLATYYPHYDRHGQKIPNGFEEMEARIEAFITDVKANT